MAETQWTMGDAIDLRNRWLDIAEQHGLRVIVDETDNDYIELREVAEELERLQNRLEAAEIAGTQMSQAAIQLDDDLDRTAFRDGADDEAHDLDALKELMAGVKKWRDRAAPAREEKP